MSAGAIAFGVLWTSTLLLAVAMVAMVFTLLETLGTDQALTGLFALLSVEAIAFSTVGLLTELRRPGNRIAWVLGAAGVLIVIAFAGFAIGALRYVAYGADDRIGGVAALIGGAMLGPALFTAGPLLAVLFPDGRLPSPRWRPFVAVAIIAVAVPSIVGVLQPGPVNADLPDNPIGIDDPTITALRPLAALFPLGFLLGAVLGIAAITVRFRRSHGVERAQVKWLLAAVAVIAVLVPLSFNDGFLDSSGGFTVIDVLAMASLGLLPAAVGIAILRYRLYEIDRLISRTLGWAIVTGVLVAVFVGLVVGLQAILTDVTQGQTLAVAASTLVAFALFQPIRRRVQHAVDRRFDRARYDAERTATAFAERLRDDVDITTVTHDLATTAGTALAPSTLSIWLRRP